MNAIIPAPANPLVPQTFDEAIRLAKAMSIAKAVPEHLQGDVGSCLMVVEQALRWRMSPFAVAQCTSSIKGKLMHEGKLIAAVVETSGAIDGYLNYKFGGEGETRSITVSATRRGEAEPKEMTILLKNVITSNEQWRKQPDQQLVYSGARNWARRWTPAVILGVYSPEEFDRTSGNIVTADGPIIEHEPAQKPTGGMASTEREQINNDVPLSEPKPQKLTWPQLLDSFEMALKDAATADEIAHILQSNQMTETKAHIGKAKPEHQKRFDAIMAMADQRRSALTMDAAEAALDDDLPWPGDEEAPAIKGEQYVAAG